MTLTTTAAFIRRLMSLRRWSRQSRAAGVDAADLGTAFGLESAMMSADDAPLVQRLSARDRSILHPRRR